jgi:hypothetical protein
MLGVQPKNSHGFNVLNFLDPNLSSPFQTAVCWSHLVAGKGRMASDRCGGGGRSSGTGLEGVTPACPGSLALQAPPAVGVDGDKARDLPIGPRLRRPVSPERDRDRVRLGLNRAAHRTLANNERAERSASSKRYLSKNPGRCPALRVPFQQLSERSREAANTCPTWRLRRLSAPTGGGGRVHSRPLPPVGEDDREAVRRGQVGGARAKSDDVPPSQPLGSPRPWRRIPCVLDWC